MEGVTKLTRVQYVSKEEEQMENLRKMLMAMSKDIRVILVKIADRLHNMRTMDYQTAEKQKQKSLETMEFTPPGPPPRYAEGEMGAGGPVAALPDPVGYRDINDRLEVHRAEHEAFMAHIQSQIEERLKEIQVDYTKVYGRIKHTYSIYRKMYSQGKTLEQIYDLFAFRVIVKTIPDCYNVLGVMHDLYKPVLGRFKDYIGTPKAQHVPVSAHHGHRRRGHPLRGADPHRGNAPDRRIRYRRPLEIQAERPGRRQRTHL